MPDQKEQLEDLLQYIRDRRSDEYYFDDLYHKLEEMISTNSSRNTGFVERLKEVKEKQAEAYRPKKIGV